MRSSIEPHQRQGKALSHALHTLLCPRQAFDMHLENPQRYTLFMGVSSSKKPVQSNYERSNKQLTVPPTISEKGDLNHVSRRVQLGMSADWPIALYSVELR